MINTLSHQTIDKLRNVEQTKDSEEHEDNLPFTFFDDADGSTVDVGIGTEIDPTLRHLPIVDPDPSTPSDPAEPAHEDDPQPEPDQPTPADQPSSVLQAPLNPEEQVPQDEIKSNFGLIIAAAEQSDNPEPDSPPIDDFKEQISKSAKLFEETRSHMSSRNITVNQSTHSTEPTGFLDIEVESVEAAPLPIDNLERLDEEYTKPKDNVGGLIINGKLAATDKSSSKSSEPWAVRVFIVAPIKRLFRSLYNGVREAVGYIGEFIAIVILILILTIVFNMYLMGSELSESEIVMPIYEGVKKFCTTVWEDISSAFRDN